MPKRKRTDYCNADARRNDAKYQKSREVRILDAGCTTRTLERAAFCYDAQYDCLSPLSGGIRAYAGLAKMTTVFRDRLLYGFKEA